MPIIVCPLSQARELARDKRAARAVSLLDPGTPFPPLFADGAGQHLRVEVHDTEADHPDLGGPRETHVREILDFVAAWDRGAPILIHCFAGISRSTATAFITACAHNPDIEETRIAAALRKASPSASPNRRLVALADAAMGRAGRMIGAIEAIGRGDRPWWEIGEAKPFVLDSRFASEQ